MTLDLAYPSITTKPKEIIVNGNIGFPAPVAGEILLKADTLYLVVANTTIADTLVLSNNTVVKGENPAISMITYTGTGVMFKAVNNSVEIIDLTLSCATGTLLDITGTDVETFDMTHCIVLSCDIGGTITNMFIFILTETTLLDIKTNGFLFVNAITGFRSNGGVVNLNGGTLYDLGTATFDQISVENTLNNLASGTIFLDGLVDSGNINTGGSGLVHNSRFSGAGTILNNITTEDALWTFFINDDILDTRSDALTHFSSNATATVITTINVPVLIAGTWVTTRTSQFTSTVAGRLTYVGGKDVVLPITVSVTSNPVSGNGRNIGFSIFINGSEVGHTVSQLIDFNDSKNTTIIWQSRLSTNDFIEVFVENGTDTANVLVEAAVFRIN